MPSALEKVFIGVGGVAGGALVAWRTMFPWIGYDLQLMNIYAQMGKRIMSDIENKRYVIDMFEEQVAKFPNKPLLIFEDKIYTYAFMNEQACKVANVVGKWGLNQGDTVAIYFQNEPGFIWTMLGCLKLGLGVAFLNYNTRADPLLNSIKLCGAKVVIVGQEDELFDAVDEIRGRLSIPVYLSGVTKETVPSHYISWDDLLLESECSDVSKSVRSNINLLSPCVYIFTSGTTGLPKPVIINTGKGINCSKFLALASVTPDDVIYTVTPLYHSAATMALFSVFDTGATMVLKRKFSARQFWSDCRRHNVTVAQYIGELCRYLLALPESPDDGNHKVVKLTGNGLRPDIWEIFQKRFKVPKIIEFFGATEGTSAMINVSGKVGAIGRLSPYLAARDPLNKCIVRYDRYTEQPLRDKNGRCQKCDIGESGVLIAGIPPLFEEGFYKGGKEMNEKKIVRDAFEKGDAYFNYGDLMYFDKDYFVYFKDRVGDTFRWKGENVSTNEVANILTKLDFIQDANVYGVEVPGADGRAGMAAIQLKNGVDFKESMLTEIYHHCQEHLPSYARPLFLRHTKEMTITATFKQRKVEAVKEGFDPTKVKDSLFYISPKTKTYEPLTVDTYPQVLQSKL